MKIAVCLKQVVTRDTRIRLDSSAAWIREEEATWALNEPDAYALEEALRIKDRQGGEVIAVSAGPARVAQVLREALARGADRAIHVDGSHLAAADAFTTASALASALSDERPDLVLTGLQSDDQGFAQVGVVLAEYLGTAHATIVVAVEIHDRTLRVKRELEGGWFQWGTMPLPAVITVQSGINQLRYATLKGVMAAKKKELRTVAAPPPAAVTQRIMSVALPERTKHTRILSGSPAETVSQLVTALRDDARVI